MKTKINGSLFVFIILVIGALMLGGCLNSPNPDVLENEFSHNDSPSTMVVSIETDIKRYSSLMSSSIGIGMTPVIGDSITDNYEFQWSTEYGIFFYWIDDEFTEFGQYAINNGAKIYWSFYSMDELEIDDIFEVHLEVKDKKTGALIGNSNLKLQLTESMFVDVIE